MSQRLENNQASATPEQQALDKLIEFLDEAPQLLAQSRIAGTYALKFCKKPPLGYNPKSPDPQNELGNLQINTINHFIASIGKPLEIEVEAPNQQNTKLKVLQFHSFDQESNSWNILGSDGKNVGIANISADHFTKELRLAE